MNASASKVLMVDDESHVLDAFRRSIGRRFSLVTAMGGEAALEIMRNEGPFAVAVTDMRMPNMTGIQFLELARAEHPDTVYLMLTGNSDQGTAVEAINRGHIFRFLNKPCQYEALADALNAAIRQYELVTAERILLRDTLNGSIRVLADTLELGNPELADVITGVRENVPGLCRSLGFEPDWRFTTAAAVCMLGYMVMNPVDDGAVLREDTLSECADCAARLLGSIPRIEPVVAMIARQRESGGLPKDIRVDDHEAAATIGARLLRISLDIERVRRGTIGSEHLLATLRHDVHADRLVPACQAILALPQSDARRGEATVHCDVLDVLSLREGMTIEENIVGSDGRLLLGKGQRCTEAVIERLRAFARQDRIQSKICVSWTDHRVHPASRFVERTVLSP